MEEKENRLFEDGLEAALAPASADVLKAASCAAVDGMDDVRMYFLHDGKPVTREEAVRRYGTERSFTEAAQEAALRNHPLRVELMKNILPVSDEIRGLFVASDERMISGDGNGAAEAVLPGSLERIAETAGGSFFLLPSSMNEMLVFSDEGACNLLGAGTELRNKPFFMDAVITDIENIQRDTIGKNVMRGDLAPERIVTSHAFHYDAVERVLESCEDFARRARGETFDRYRIVQTGIEKYPYCVRQTTVENGREKPPKGANRHFCRTMREADEYIASCRLMGKAGLPEKRRQEAGKEREER